MLSVIVTGGSRGLGLAIVTTLAEAGYRVIAIARNPTPELRQIAQTKPVEFRAFDLSETARIASFVTALCKELGPIHGLVNNAGIGHGSMLTLMHDEQIESLLRLNTLSPILFAKYVLRSMMVEKAGRIVNITSIVANTGYGGLSVYSASKASLVGFTRSLAREVGQLGITVNAVAPGFIDTEMTHGLGEADRERIARRSALRRMAEAKDVAGSVEFLLSDKARNITGTTLTVDAGNTA